MKFFTTKEAALYLGCGMSFLYNTRNLGKRPHSVYRGETKIVGYLQNELDSYRKDNPLTTMKSCKVCLREKTRTRGTRRGNEKGFKYVDSANKEWDGITCPDCVKNKAPKMVTKARKCRDCKKPLDAQFYFKCINCTSKIEYMDWEEAYGVSGI